MLRSLGLICLFLTILLAWVLYGSDRNAPPTVSGTTGIVADPVPSSGTAEFSAPSRSPSTAGPAESIVHADATAWWSDQSRLEDLRKKWFEVHAWNVDARVKEFAERRAGTTAMERTFELAGNLLEDYPLGTEEFRSLAEQEKEAISISVQAAANRRVKYGKDPFNSLDRPDADRLKEEVMQQPLQFPTSYLPDALGHRYQDLSGTAKLELAELRISYLKRLAPLVADGTDRKTTALHLAQREGFWDEYQTVSHLPLLDPTYPLLEQQIALLASEYRDAVARALIH